LLSNLQPNREFHAPGTGVSLDGDGFSDKDVVMYGSIQFKPKTAGAIEVIFETGGYAE
jgi:hypothetical protein